MRGAAQSQASSSSCAGKIPNVKQPPDEWMLRKLQHAVATGSDYLAYGRDDLNTAASTGAIAVLLIGADIWLSGSATHGADEIVVSKVRAHGGRVVRAHTPNKELDMLGACALLRFPLPEITDVESEGGTGEEVPSAASAPPAIKRTLTYFAPWGAPVAPIGPVPPAVADEIELLSAMFGDEKKLRMAGEPYDGTHLLLQVDSVEHTACYLILELVLPPAYPAAAPPLVSAPFGTLNGRRLTSEETAACAAWCLEHAAEEKGAPVLYSLYEAAREWLTTTAAAAAA